MTDAEYDVFVSFKKLDEQGSPTRDSVLAREVYEFLASRGLRVFLSDVALEQKGVSAYKEAIDNALDVCRVMVAVGTCPENLLSKWVRYEWDGFYSDILEGVKPEGRVFAYLDGVDIRSLPRALRKSQTFHHGPDSLTKLYNFVSRALGDVLSHAPSASAATLSSEMPGRSEKAGRPRRDPATVSEPDGADVAVYDVFLSYAREDGDWVRANLYEPLTRCRTSDGRKPEILLEVDKESVPQGTNFMVFLARAIAKSRNVVAVYTTTYFSREWCQWELGRVVELDPTGEQRKLMPILVDPGAANSVPLSASGIPYITIERDDWFGILVEGLGFTAPEKPN